MAIETITINECADEGVAIVQWYEDEVREMRATIKAMRSQATTDLAAERREGEFFAAVFEGLMNEIIDREMKRLGAARIL